MSDVSVVTDSGSDLSPELQERHHVRVVPLVVRFGTETYLDGQLTPDGLWRKIHDGAPHPGTSQPSVGVFEEAFAELLEHSDHILCATITSKHSGTYNSACAASQRFAGRVTVFDTLSLSLAQGYQAIVAARAAAKGASIEEIVALLESIRARTHVFIALDTIEYLRRGGRADAVMPVLERVARVLSIKPVLELVDGQLSLFGAVRSREKAVQRIAEQIEKHAPAEMLIALHTRLSDQIAEFARALSERLSFPLAETLVGEAGPALSCHAGPGVIAAAIVQRQS